MSLDKNVEINESTELRSVISLDDSMDSTSITLDEVLRAKRQRKHQSEFKHSLPPVSWPEISEIFEGNPDAVEDMVPFDELFQIEPRMFTAPSASSFQPFDWTLVRAQLLMDYPKGSSRVVFVSQRAGDMALEPRGEEVTKVPYLVLLEPPGMNVLTAQSCAPTHFMIKAELKQLHPEDYTPDHYVSLASRNLVWRRVRHGSTPLNIFLLAKKGERWMESVTAPMSFVFNFDTNQGNSSVDPASVMDRGNTISPSSFSLYESSIVLWNPESLRTHRTQWSHGIRITMKDVTACAPLSSLTIDNDLMTPQEATMLVLKRFWRKKSAVGKKITSYAQNLPIEVKLTEKERDFFFGAINRSLDKIMMENLEWKELYTQLYDKLVDTLTPVLDERRRNREAELALVRHVTQKLQRGELVVSYKWKIFKLCPSNKVLPFRVEGKIPGLGKAHGCMPECYVFVNPLLQ